MAYILLFCAELYHTDMVKVPAPHAAPPHLGGVHTIGQSSSAVSTNNSSAGHHSTDGGVTGFTASQLPTTSSSGRSNKGNYIVHDCRCEMLCPVYPSLSKGNKMTIILWGVHLVLVTILATRSFLTLYEKSERVWYQKACDVCYPYQGW